MFKFISAPIAMLILTFSWSVFATSVDKTPIVATVVGLKDGVTQITLLADGRLAIQILGQVNTLKLTNAQATELIEDAKKLSQIEVKQIKKIVVCAAMPKPSLSDLSIYKYNKTTKKFEMPAKLILNSTGCWKSVSTVPADAEKLVLAQEFRAELVSLALEAKFEDKAAGKVKKGLCLETAKAMAYQAGVTETQGNEPLVQDEVVLVESKKYSKFDPETYLTYEISVDNVNEDGETWTNIVSVEVVNHEYANSCIMGEAKLIKTIDTGNSFDK